MMRRWSTGPTGLSLKIALIGALTLTAGGCWNRREINELAIISSAAIDLMNAPGSGRGQAEDRQEKGLIEVTEEFFRVPSRIGANGGGGGGLPIRQISLGTGAGVSLASAIEEMDTKVPRRPYWAHAVAAIVGEDLARSGMREVLDFWDRDPEPRRSAFILLCRGEARKLMTTAQGGLERTLGQEIQGVARTITHDGHGFVPTIHEFILDIAGDAGSSALPFLALNPQPFPPPPGPPRPGGEKPDLKEPIYFYTLRIDGMGLIHKDKLIGELTPRESRGLAWTKGKVASAIVTVKCPECGDDLSVRIRRASASLQAKMKESKPSGIVKVQVEGDISEQRCQCNMTRDGSMKSLQRRVAQAIRNEIESAIAKAQHHRADVFGFASALHRKEPRAWKKLKSKWREEFRTMPIKVEVDAAIRRTGITGKAIPLGE